MNILKAYSGMSALLLQAANATGESQFHPHLFQNLRFCDNLLQRMGQDQAVPEAVRIEVYTTLLSAGPGGLLAFVWLLRGGHISAKLLDNYVECLQAGPPAPEALDERAALEATETLFRYKEIGDEQQLSYATRLLGCTAFSRVARLALLKRFLSGSILSPSCRYPLSLWATSSPGPADEQSHGVCAGEELFRCGLVARAQLGEDLGELLRTYGKLEAQDEGEISSTWAEGLLDLLEVFKNSAPSLERQELLAQLRSHSDPKVRRRAYQLGENSEGESFLRLGLRDLDAGVRSWVLARVTQKSAIRDSRSA